MGMEDFLFDLFLIMGFAVVGFTLVFWWESFSPNSKKELPMTVKGLLLIAWPKIWPNSQLPIIFGLVFYIIHIFSQNIPFSVYLLEVDFVVLFAFLVNIFILSLGLSSNKELNYPEQLHGSALPDSEKDNFHFWLSITCGSGLLYLVYDGSDHSNFLHDNGPYGLTFIGTFMIWLAARFICYEAAHNLSVIRKIFTTSDY